jgi:hypothetical protein
VRGKAAEGITSFPLPLEQPAPGSNAAATAFVPNSVYLEVRVQQIWLTQQRELWSEFQPFLAVVTGFIHQGEERSLPAMLGSSELSGKMSLIDKADAVEIRNVRVAGPVPYEGDNVSILVALFRTKTKDWLARTLGVVEKISQAVGASALVAAKPIADSVISALTQFLGDDGLELRCGQYQSWPRAEDPEHPNSTDLRPMHYVVMRRPMSGDGGDPGAGFSVLGGRLHFVEGGEPRPYTAHDFVLLSVEPKRLRDDYKKLEFYKFWQATKERLVAGEPDVAEREWRKTAGALYTDELTEPQQKALYAEYKAHYDELLDQLAEASTRGIGTRTVMLEFEDPDPAEIILASTE